MIPITLEKNVSLSDLKPQTLVAVMSAWAIFISLGANEFVLTSVNDGIHSRKSLHRFGYAVDIRIWVLTEAKRVMAAKKIADALGKHFDVVLEPDHLHIEYDPKVYDK